MAGDEAVKTQLRVADAQRRMATRDMLLNLHRQRRTEFIDSLDAEVSFVSMGASTRDRIEKETGYGTDEFDKTKYTMLSLIACIEEPRLSEADLEALMDQDIRVVDELSLHVTLINFVGGDPEEAKKALQKIQNSDSDSSSQSD